MQKCNLAVDIGASSGRVIAGYLENNQLLLEEIHRFDNNMIKKDGHLCWDIDRLFSEIKTGLRKSVEMKYQPQTVGIDTWAVDFVLLDEQKNRITDAVAYRDHRTDGSMEKVFQRIDQQEIYQQTGIQFQPFNTIYQLHALKQESPEIFDKAAYFLMVPDYLHYLLTGKITNEYTNATTTQLLNAGTQQWEKAFLEKIGIPDKLFSEPTMPMQSIGSLTDELQKELGFNLDVVLPGTHDTASAVVSVPAQDTIYISSGTWSLMGVEHDSPISSPQAFQYNFTNEGGASENIRFLKNIMGLWMIQEVRREYNEQYSFAEFVELVEQEANFTSKVDVNDQRFLSPESMKQVIQEYCQETNQQLPETPGQFAKCIYDSLVECYDETAKEIEELTGKTYNSIHIIGGGSKNNYMNKKLAEVSGKSIFTGPSEATAIGNLIAQMLATGQLPTIEASKEIINNSFDIQKF
ncbi:rhamnulokinase [Gracilibacillus caseinilyticus]|uniref:Rhamnulokinase n=1 Tax=Gracilibacillus caseinilyticus TaxID=2932256 RepID=A0ABY4ETT9_9BACI|nr:rhamnulokinase [Gracilibacillus caseinilyticus]UOQ47689.1 rhamnulokinase [Gracilibacillus caseinilyticus]